MKNTLGDLTSYLFDQLDRLSNDDLKGEELQEEISRGKAIGEVAKNIIANGSLVLEAEKLKAKGYVRADDMPKMLEG